MLKRLYLTKQHNKDTWHYIGDPVHPTTTTDAGLIRVNPEDIKVDAFGAYIEVKCETNSCESTWSATASYLKPKSRRPIITLIILTITLAILLTAYATMAMVDMSASVGPNPCNICMEVCNQ